VLHGLGSMDKAENPEGVKKCFPGLASDMQDCSNRPDAETDCSCLVPKHQNKGCLFGDMRPSKLLAAISLSRAMGINHLIEEGRYGGLSAYVYNLHGLKVTSIEYSPLNQVMVDLEAMAPGVALLNGDGAKLLPEILSKAEANDRIAVIFDGEKRFQAWETYLKIRHKLVFAIFDDTNIDGGAFRKMLADKGEKFWNTDDPLYKSFQYMDSVTLAKFDHIWMSGKHIAGNVEKLVQFQFTIVQGPLWDLNA